MYRIVCKNNENEYILHDERYPNLQVIEPKLSLEVNASSKLTFNILPTHQNYQYINVLSSEILVFEGDGRIFSGRVLNIASDFYNRKSITCEGELGYLLDSNQRQAEYHNISVKDYFGTLISKHNAMVESNHQFTVGTVNVTDPNDSLYRFSNYEDTFNTIQDKLINRLGGYIRTRRSNGVKYIDYIKDYGNINTQTIEFGKNLLDLTQFIKGENVKTALIPLGAKVETPSENENTECEERVTIESVNGGLDYVYDEDSVNLFGWIYDVATFDDIHIPSILKTRGEQELAKYKLLSYQIEIKGVDLHLLDVNVEKIKLGDMIRIISKPHKVDRFMLVSQLELDLVNPQNSVLTLGGSQDTLTDISNKNNVKADVEIIKSDYLKNQDFSQIKNNFSELSSSISQSAENILLEVYSKCATKDDIDSATEYFKSSIDVLNNMIEFKFNTATSQTTSLEEKVTSNQTLLEEYIRFQGALIELGRVGNDFTAQLSNTELAFLQNNVKIAYINNNKMNITDAEVKNKLSIGNFDFKPRSNGNLSFLWGGN